MKKKRHYLTEIEICLIILFFAVFLVFMQKPTLMGFTIYQAQPNPDDGKDNYIRNTSTLNYGTETTMKLGKTAAALEYRSLLEFDVSSVESTNTITSGNIQVYVSTLNTANITIKAYRLTSEWNETASTWNNRTTTSTWSTEGGDYDATLLDSVFIDSINTWYNFSITTAARGWINGSYTNYGIILIPDAETGNNHIAEIISSDYAVDTSLRPMIIVDYTTNAVPTINSISVDSNLTNIKKVGQSVTFTVDWTDLESNSARLFVCNTSEINTTACVNGTFCSTTSAQTNPASCSYTIQNTDNRTTNVWIAMCDSGNCSDVNQTSFSMNHLPTVLVVQPNGGETVNQSQGNYTIKFNITDADSDKLFGDIYYGATQNSTTYAIGSNLNLTKFCTDADSDTATTNPGTYSWNSTGVYGNYFLTVVANDSYHSANDSSDSAFDVRSLTDDTAPNITAQWIEGGELYSGKQVQIYANISEPNIQQVWFEVNASSVGNVTMSNASATEFNGSFTAPQVGKYQFKVYANDTIGNLNNSMSWETFNISKPNATFSGMTAPSTALPYHTIRVSADLNATHPLRDVFAYLYVPSGFLFLSDYPQNTNSGNYSAGENKTANWMLSAPITESSYNLNATFTDYFSNTWNSSNTAVDVSTAGATYSVSVAGYPEVETSGNYFAQASFTSGGVLTNADSVTIKIYDSIGSLIVGPAAMTSSSETGKYNYSYTVGASANEGQWETIVNATKGTNNYYANQFWKVVGGVFDVRDITVNDGTVPALSISVTLENTGGVDKDMFLFWNLTVESNQTYIISGLDTVRVSAYSTKTHTITPSTNFVGQLRITFIGEYSDGEKAGAYKVFSTTSGVVSCGDGICNGDETCSSCPTDCGVCPSPGGGGGGGGITITAKKYDMKITTEEQVTLTKNIAKNVSLEIENTGTSALTNLILEISGLNASQYKISPSKINKISSGKKEKFEIEFSARDFVGETEIIYLVKSNELNKSVSAKLISVDIKDYFLNEIKKLLERISSVKEKTEDEKILDELKVCEQNVAEAASFIEKEQFINAKNSIEEADICVSSVEDKIKGEPKFTPLKMEGYGVWIVTWILIGLLIIAIGVILYLLYKKFGVISFLRQQGEAGMPIASPKAVEDTYFDKKISEIEKKLSA